MNTDVSKLIVEIVDAAETDVGSVDIHRALRRRLRNKTPGYSTVQKKLAELVEEGRLARTRITPPNRTRSGSNIRICFIQ